MTLFSTWFRTAMDGNNITMQNYASKTVSELLNWATDYLSSYKIQSSHLDAEVLFGYCLGIPRGEVFLKRDEPVKQDVIRIYTNFIKQRAGHIPVAYLLNEKDFMGLRFFVNQDVLIPRPETELLVEEVIKQSAISNKPSLIIDIGTGCGNIAVSLAKFVEEAKVYATDIEPKAIKIAKINASMNVVSDKIEFFCGDLFAALADSMKGKIDIIVSNPPYIKTADFAKLSEEIKMEPHKALDGGEDGLDLYRRIIPESHDLLKTDGWLFLEIGDSHRNSVEELLKKSGFTNLEFLKDYSEKDRIVKATRQN